MLPLTGFLASADGSTVHNDVAAHPVHTIQQQQQGKLPLVGLLTGADDRAVGDHVHSMALGAELEESQGVLPASGLFAGADRRAPGDQLPFQTLRRDLEAEAKGPLPLLCLPAAADRCVECNDICSDAVNADLMEKS